MTCDLWPVGGHTSPAVAYYCFTCVNWHIPSSWADFEPQEIKCELNSLAQNCAFFVINNWVQIHNFILWYQISKCIYVLRTKILPVKCTLKYQVSHQNYVFIVNNYIDKELLKYRITRATIQHYSALYHITGNNKTAPQKLSQFILSESNYFTTFTPNLEIGSYTVTNPLTLNTVGNYLSQDCRKSKKVLEKWNKMHHT